MTVRAWFTISAVLLVVLTGAVVYQFVRPISPPDVLVTSGAVRLDDKVIRTCWPQRDGEVTCDNGHEGAEAQTVKPKGTFRIVVAYPAQPKNGAITIRGGRKIFERRDDWDRAVEYDLEPGRYTLTVLAQYPADAWLQVEFPFRVTRSGD